MKKLFDVLTVEELRILAAHNIDPTPLTNTSSSSSKGKLADPPPNVTPVTQLDIVRNNVYFEPLP